jgi:hypothetical protein
MVEVRTDTVSDVAAVFEGVKGFDFGRGGAEYALESPNASRPSHLKYITDYWNVRKKAV